MQQLQQLVGNYKILFVHQAGSNAFCSNCRDNDYLVVIENWNKPRGVLRVGNAEYFCYSTEQFQKLATLSQNSKSDMFALCLALGKTMYGANPLGFYNWFAYKDNAVKAVLKYLGNHLDGKVTSVNGGGDSCSKILCWAFATYFAIANGNLIFTAEQKDILQRCHDKTLPLSYAKQLKADLQSLIALVA